MIKNSFRFVCYGVAALACLSVQSPAAEAPLQPQSIGLTEYLARVWQNNETVQMHMLESAAAGEREQAERGIFDPVFFMDTEAVDKRRPNTSEQIRSTFSAVFNERNRVYQGGVEQLISTGAKFKLGYSVSHLENNYITGPEDGEFLTTFGLNFTQPLLKNGGKTVTFAGIRAAAVQSEVTFQTYRKGIMELMVRAEAAYWDLYQAQEQVNVARDSVRVARTLLADNKKRLEVGKGNELDVLQAESGLSSRQAVESEAVQRLQDSQSRVATFLSQSWAADRSEIRATDKPNLKAVSPSFGELWPEVPMTNPDYLGAIKQAELEGLRVTYAKNQSKPELNLRGGYGASHVSSNAGTSMNLLSDQKFPSWSIGMEFRMPLGSRRGFHDKRAAELRAESAGRALDNLGVQLSNGLRAALESVRSYRENQPRYQKVVDANSEVLKNQLARLDAGKTDSREVLRAEDDLFRSRISVIENIVRYQRATLDLDYLQGIVLKKRNLDLTQKELRERTAVLTQRGKLTPEQFDMFLQDLKQEYDRRVGTSKPEGQ